MKIWRLSEIFALLLFVALFITAGIAVGMFIAEPMIDDANSTYFKACDELSQKRQIIKSQESVIQNKNKQIVQLNKRIDELEQKGMKSLGTFKITAYGRDCEGCTGITKTGTVPIVGRTVAVDPDVIPLGSTVIIDGQEYIAEDIGGAIKVNIIDMFVGTEDISKYYGVKYKEVFVKGEGEGE